MERTFLRHRHAVFDAQIAHRRHRGPADFAHGTRSCGRANVCAERRTGQPIRRDNRHRNRAAAPRDARVDSRIRAEAISLARPNGQRPRVLLLVFRGEDAVEKIHHTVGHIVNERTSGETIRDTFGDYIADESGKVIYFEPAVLAAIRPRAVEQDLKLWAEFSDPDGGILENVIAYPPSARTSKRHWS